MQNTNGRLGVLVQQHGEEAVANFAEKYLQSRKVQRDRAKLVREKLARVDGLVRSGVLTEEQLWKD